MNKRFTVIAAYCLLGCLLALTSLGVGAIIGAIIESI